MLPTFTAAPLGHFRRTIEDGATERFNVQGQFFRIMEADYAANLLVSFDNGPFMRWDLAISANFQPFGYTFREVSIRNTAESANAVEFYAGFAVVGDDRLNIVESRSGGAATHVPTGFGELVWTSTGAGYQQIAGLDLSRAEIRLETDQIGKAWFGHADGFTRTDARKIGLNWELATTLRTRAPLWAYASEAGVTVRAFVFTF